MNTAPEILEIRELARTFAGSELRPHAEHWDAAGGFDDALVAKLAELGFFGMLLSEDAGGMGFDLAATVAALEELAWGEAGAALLVAENIIAADLIARHGTAGLRDEWLPRLAAGDATACVVTSGQVQSADGHVSGTARFVLNGARAVLALVGAADGVYVVPRDGGFTSGAPADSLGLRSIGLADVQFAAAAGVAVRLDAPAADTAVARLATAAIAVGIAQAALDHAVRYANEREQFGQPIRSFEGIQYKLAEMATRTAGARALVQAAAADAADDTAIAMAKLAAATAAMYVTTEAVQVFGGYGYMRDYPVEKLMRDAKAMELLHGTNEAERLRIAASLYA